MTIFDIINNLNHQRFILAISKNKTKEMILNDTYDEVIIEDLGKVENINVIQYLMGKMIIAQGNEIEEEYYRMFLTAFSLANITVLNHLDSLGNNLLHYCGVYGNFEITKNVLDKGIDIVKNSNRKHAFELTKDEKTKKLLMNWTKNIGNEIDIEINTASKQNEITFKNDEAEANSEENEKQGSVVTSSSSLTQSQMHNLRGVLNERPYHEFTSSDSLNELLIRNEKLFQPRPINEIKKMSRSINRLHNMIKPNFKYIDEAGMEEREILKYPGRLYVHLGSIIGFYTIRPDVESVCIKVICGERTYFTPFFTPSSHIEVNDLLEIPVSKANFVVKIFLVVRFKRMPNERRIFGDKPDRKILKSHYKINKDIINRLHNNLVQRDQHFRKYHSPNILRNISDLFDKELPDANLVTCYFSYVSDGDFKYIRAPKPVDYKSLSYWLHYRLNSFNFWYSGCVNVRGDGCEVATRLWKCRFICWKGYEIQIYNEQSKCLIGKIDLSGARYEFYKEDTHSDVYKNSITIFKDESNLQIQFDKIEDFEMGVTVLQALFPV